jgi:hypothetical protein
MATFSLNVVVLQSMAKGGKRTGAGRPRRDPSERTVKTSVSLDPRVLQLIDSYASREKLSRTAAIETLVQLGIERTSV